VETGPKVKQIVLNCATGARRPGTEDISAAAACPAM
jgi:hypothetical protein